MKIYYNERKVENFSRNMETFFLKEIQKLTTIEQHGFELSKSTYV